MAINIPTIKSLTTIQNTVFSKVVALLLLIPQVKMHCRVKYQVFTSLASLPPSSLGLIKWVTPNFLPEETQKSG